MIGQRRFGNGRDALRNLTRGGTNRQAQYTGTASNPASSVAANNTAPTAPVTTKNRMNQTQGGSNGNQRGNRGGGRLPGFDQYGNPLPPNDGGMVGGMIRENAANQMANDPTTGHFNDPVGPSGSMGGSQDNMRSIEDARYANQQAIINQNNEAARMKAIEDARYANQQGIINRNQNDPFANPTVTQTTNTTNNTEAAAPRPAPYQNFVGAGELVAQKRAAEQAAREANRTYTPSSYEGLSTREKIQRLREEKALADQGRGQDQMSTVNNDGQSPGQAALAAQLNERIYTGPGSPYAGLPADQQPSDTQPIREFATQPGQASIPGLPPAQLWAGGNPDFDENTGRYRNQGQWGREVLARMLPKQPNTPIFNYPGEPGRVTPYRQMNPASGAEFLRQRIGNKGGFDNSIDPYPTPVGPPQVAY